jgi:hypothetical protein
VSAVSARAERVAELEVYRRHVVERADPHGRQRVRDPRALLGHPRHAVRPLVRHAELVDAGRPDFDEAVQHRGHQHLAATMGLQEEGALEELGIRRQLCALPERGTPRALYLPAHLLRQPEERALLERVGGDLGLVHERCRAAGLGGRGQEHAHHLLLGKYGENRDEIREALVKGRLVGARGIEIALAQGVDQGMRGLVHHDVVREAGVDRVAAGAGEIAEDQALGHGVIEGIGVQHPMRRDLELVGAEGPAHAPAERELEAGQRLHDERVHVLGMEPEVVDDLRLAPGPFRRLVGEAVGQVVGAVEAPRGGIVVHHLHAVPDGPGDEILRGHCDLCHEDGSLGAVLSNTGILRDDREVALGGQRGDGIHRALGFLHGVLRP